MATKDSNNLDTRVQTKNIIDSVQQGIKDQFPIKGNRQSLVLNDVWVQDSKDRDYEDFPKEREVKLSGRSWTIPAYADVSLVDNATGRVIDRSKKVKIAEVPKITNRFSVIIDGNEYQTTNQFRLKTGIYTRVKNNGEVESQFNLDPGFNFKMTLDPGTLIFRLNAENRKYHVLNILRHLFQIPESIIKEAWGKKIFDANVSSAMGKETKEITDLYSVVSRDKVGYEKARAALVEYFSRTGVSAETTKITLGESHENVNGDTLLATSKKLLGVMRGDQKPDERDSLIFKDLYTVDDLLNQFFLKRGKELKKNLGYRIDSKSQVRDVINTKTYGAPIKEFFTRSDLVSAPPQTNPVNILDEWRKTTIMGTGGVTSDHAITMDVRNVHPSTMGYLDPVATPESGKVGVTLGLAVGAGKEEGNLVTTVFDKTGKKLKLTPAQLHQAYIGFPDEYEMVNGKPKAKGAKVRGIYQGKTDIYPASKIDYFIAYKSGMFSISTNLIPFLAHNQGNRAMMGNRMMGQAISITEREAPNVRIKLQGESKKSSGQEYDTFEDIIGNYLNPQADEAGEVTKIDKDYIHVKNRKGETKKFGLYNNFPLNQEAFLQSNPLVKKGDKVKKGQFLAENNFNKDGHLALGKNVNVAYMPWHGYNFEDAAVATESFAKQFSHESILKKSKLISQKGELNLNKFRAYFPKMIDQANASILDTDGVVKEGSTVKTGQILIAYMQEKDPSDDEMALKNLNRTIAVPFKPGPVTWDYEYDGVITDVKRVGNEINVYVKVTQPLVVGDKIAGKHGNKCYRDNYLALTSASGWKYIKDIDIKEDMVATLNQETGKLEWQYPTEVHEYDYDGRMYKVSGEHILLETTDNHRHYCKIRKHKDGKDYFGDPEILYPEEMFGKRKKFIRHSDWDGELENNTDGFVEDHLLKEFFEYSGWFISEGWTTDGAVVCCQSPDKGAGLDKIKELSTKLFGKYNCYPQKNGVEQITIYDKNSAEKFREWFGHLSHNKKIPAWMKNAPKEYLRVLLDALMLGDGSEEANRIRYFSTSERLVHDVAEIGIKLGYAPQITNRKQKLVEIDGVQVKSAKLLYIVSLNRVQGTEPLVNHPQSRNKEEWVDYKGKVVCLTVPNSIFLVTSDEKFTPTWTGNSIISKIIADHEAPHTPDGKRIDLMLNPHGVPGRVNAGQILETAAGKLVEATGKPYEVSNFDGTDHIDNLKKEYEKNGLEFDEQLLDGKDGKPFKNKVFTGNQYIMKLKHTVEHKLKARGAGAGGGGYDYNEQPSKGETGGQSLDPMQMYALVAHGAKENLYEMSALKGQKNDEFWRALQLGLPLPKPNKNFAFEKMENLLKGAGVNVEKNGDTFKLLPLTDKEVDKMSSGKISPEAAGRMIRGKDLRPEAGGIFDEQLTGGHNGTKWTHMDMPFAIPNPMFEDSINKVLGITSTEFNRRIKSKDGIMQIRAELESINVDKELAATREELKTAPDSKQGVLNKKYRYLAALKKAGLKPHEAYMTQKVPIVPPKFRPIYPLPSGDLMTSPINKHYKDVAQVIHGLEKNEELKHVKGIDEGSEALYKSIKAMQGFIDPITYTKEKYEGVVQTLAGSQPKTGYIQNKLWSKKQDVSGRSTITLEPSLGIDEVGIPVDMAKDMYKPFIIKKLVSLGTPASSAIREVKDWSPRAERAMELVMEERPVILNRAPTLHKHGVQAFKPVKTDGKSIKLNPLIVSGFNADFDGDTMSVHVPVMQKAVDEANNLLPSKIIFKHGDNAVVPEIAMEYMLGLYFLTKDGKSTRKTFGTVAEAKKSGVGDQDIITVTGLGRTSLGKIRFNEALPKPLRDYQIVLDKSKLKKLLNEVARKYPNDFADVMNTLRDMGNQYSHEWGASISITDFDIDRTYRDKVVKETAMKLKGVDDPVKKAAAWAEAKDKIKAKLYDDLRKKDNRVQHMLDSGSAKKHEQATQLMMFPGLFEDVKGNTLAQPFVKSYAEGFNTFDYWNAMYGVRKGAINTAVNTQATGALNKELLGVNKSLVITETDCKTTKGISVGVDEKDVVDRYLAQDYPGVGRRNELVDNTLLARAKSKKIKELLVRSPLTCESVNGLCVQCYGLMPDGKPADIGDNVGIADSQAVTERATQLTLQTRHTGGAAGAQGAPAASFPRLRELVDVPKKIPNQATVAMGSGTVQNIIKAPAGGYEVYINEGPGDNRKYLILPGLVPKVKKGDLVRAGDVIGTGNARPQDIGAAKGHLEAQKFIVDEMNNIYGDNYFKKTFETVVRGISNKAVVTDAPDDSEFVRGDVGTIQYIDGLNKERKTKGLAEIKYDPKYVSIEQAPTLEDDWLSRLTTRYLKTTIRDGVAKGMETHIHGSDPMPGYLYAEEFGQKGEFY